MLFVIVGGKDTPTFIDLCQENILFLNKTYRRLYSNSDIFTTFAMQLDKYAVVVTPQSEKTDK